VADRLALWSIWLSLYGRRRESARDPLSYRLSMLPYALLAMLVWCSPLTSPVTPFCLEISINRDSSALSFVLPSSRRFRLFVYDFFEIVLDIVSINPQQQSIAPELLSVISVSSALHHRPISTPIRWHSLVSLPRLLHNPVKQFPLYFACH
jgi:hypothetical protein